MEGRGELVGRQRFSGKVAFITGGATGMGRAFATALRDEGAQVVLADVDADTAKRTANELGDAALAVACDVADRSAVDRAFAEAINRCGGVDILVNNAARHHKKYAQAFSSLTTEEIEGLFDVNVLGVVNCILASSTSMRERGGGAIVNVASSAAYTVGTPYGVTKLAVRGLTITFARELGHDNIRVNAIAPGMVSTESSLAEYTEDELAAVRSAQVLKQSISMDDVTRVALFLCSEESALVTGETIRVTGGGWLSIG
jgi:NAD(P)-dependent dehydrogenase (short-subunit alcohol dehydrogenase family)